MIECVDMGCVGYQDALAWQMKLAQDRREERISDRLVLLEHTPVYTMGRRDASSDLLVSQAWLRRQGVELHKTDRGGRITYHGPGQLVGYLIFQLRIPVPELVWKIEEVLVRLLGRFHLEGTRDPKHPGVWIESRKIAAVGLRIERGVTRHGFSLNVNCDLRPYRYIHPCGLQDRGVTSLDKELGWHPPMRDVKSALLLEVSTVFETSVAMEGQAVFQPE